jgi:hypothetical protein
MRRLKNPRASAAALAALLLAGCVAQPRPPPHTDPVLAACEALWQDEQRAAADAGVTDAAQRQVAGFPHYRSTRLLASFTEDLDRPAAWQEWTDRLRTASLEAAVRERQRRGAGPLPERLGDCAARLQQADLSDAERQARLRAAVAVADDYSLTARAFGVYPLARPFLGLGVAAYQRGVREGYSEPLRADTPLRRYAARPADTAILDLARAARSALGFPLLTASDWEALAQAHAPVWEVETLSGDDEPGTPARDVSGALQFTPQALTYWYAEVTRFGDQLLPTLVYTIWFPARTPTGRFDPYAGAIDGVVWRVVLDPEGQPWVYDSIHPCGCYRYTFARADLQPRPPVPGQERPLLPQGLGLPDAPLILRLRAGDHQLLRVRTALPDEMADAVPYALAPYAVLESGRLFGPEGLIAGTERGERWWLWPSGVPSPGAMRQRGRQPTAFIGRAHFDDPRFLESLFFPPVPAPASRP